MAGLTPRSGMLDYIGHPESEKDGGWNRRPRLTKNKSQEKVMRKTIAGLVAAVGVMLTVGAAPASACGGGGLFQSSCSPCGYTACAPVYVAPVYSGCNTGCGDSGYVAVSDAGDWAPEPAYG